MPMKEGWRRRLRGSMLVHQSGCGESQHIVWGSRRCKLGWDVRYLIDVTSQPLATADLQIREPRKPFPPHTTSFFAVAIWIVLFNCTLEMLAGVSALLYRSHCYSADAQTLWRYVIVGRRLFYYETIEDQRE